MIGKIEMTFTLKIRYIERNLNYVVKVDIKKKRVIFTNREMISLETYSGK